MQIEEVLNLFSAVFIKFFFLLTPFFVLSSFIALTKDFNLAARRRLARNVTLAILTVCLVLYFFGNYLFAVAGITVDAFRIGAGGLLFLSAVTLVRGPESPSIDPLKTDIAVVPLAIPITIGPATTGALLIMGAEVQRPLQRIVGCAALCLAGVAVGLLLYLSTALERWLGARGISILSKLTGLFLSAMAAQMIFAGARNLLLK